MQNENTVERTLDTPAFFQDPYPIYARLRAEGKPFWLPHENQTRCNGIWLFSRYDDAVSIFKATQDVSKQLSSVRLEGRGTPFDIHLLHRDAPDHMRLRRLVAQFFSAARMKQIEPMVEAATESLLNTLPDTHPIDLVKHYAERLPLHVIGRIMGFPDKDLGQLRAWSHDLADGFDSVISTADVLQRQKAALSAYLAYLRQLIQARQADPQDDLISHLAAAEAKGELSRLELEAMTGFLLFAGHETTINLIGNSLLLLMQHPDQQAMLRTNPDLLPGAIEEVLRYESPEQRTSFRVATSDFRVGATTVPAGQQIGIIIGAANRDEQAFPHAERFDITRTPNRHLAFGLGPHQCLGMHMSRMEGRIAIGKILQRHAGIELSNPTPDWRRNSFFRGLSTLTARLR